MIRKIVALLRSLFGYILLGALLLAILPRFNWDIFELLFWIANTIWEIIVTVAEHFSKMPVFKQVFSG